MTVWNEIMPYAGPVGGFLLKMGVDYWYKIRKLKLLKKKDSVGESMKASVLIESRLGDILSDFEADRVYLVQFHNGGNFYPSGKSILKFSVLYEKTLPGVPLVRDKYQNIPTSIFNKFFVYLLENDISFYTDIRRNTVEELEAKGFNRENDSKSTYCAAIKTLDGKFSGVLVLQYTKKKRILNENDIKEIQIHAASLGSSLHIDSK